MFNFKKKNRKKDKENKDILSKKIDELNTTLIKSRIMDITSLIGDKKQIFFRNFIAGISRGVGIGIGVTLITAILIYILQRIVTLNIPVIGEYVSDIVKIVEKSRF